MEPAGKTPVERGRAVCTYEAVYAEVFELTAAPMSSHPHFRVFSRGAFELPVVCSLLQPSQVITGD